MSDVSDDEGKKRMRRQDPKRFCLTTASQPASHCPCSLVHAPTITHHHDTQRRGNPTGQVWARGFCIAKTRGQRIRSGWECVLQQLFLCAMPSPYLLAASPSRTPALALSLSPTHPERL
jgi:hypothetical protein